MKEELLSTTRYLWLAKGWCSSTEQAAGGAAKIECSSGLGSASKSRL